MADIGSLVVSLDARVAKFNSDVNDSASRTDKALSAIEARFKATNSAITSQLAALGGNLGFAGTLLASFGPMGLLVAASIGGAVAAFEKLSESADRLGARASTIKELSETLRISTLAFQALEETGASVGLSNEEVAKSFGNLSVKLDELRQGTGTLLEQVRRVDPALADEMQRTKDLTKEIELLAQVRKKANDEQKNAISQAAFGRGGLATGRLIDAVGAAGSVKVLADNMDLAGKLTDAEIKKYNDLRTEINKIKNDTTGIWDKVFGPDVLELQKQSAQLWKAIATAVSTIHDLMPSLDKPVPAVGGRFIQNDTETALGIDPNVMDVPLPRARPTPPTVQQPRSLAAIAADAKNLVAALGSAATASQLFDAKQKEMNADVEAGKITVSTMTQAMAGFIFVQQQAGAAVRQSIGVATEKEIRDTAIAAITDKNNKLLDKQKLTVDELSLAYRIAGLDAKKASEALQVRASPLPGLKQMEIDAGDLNKQLDILTTSQLTALSSGLVDVLTHTTTLTEGFRNFGLQAVRALANTIIQMNIMRPIAAALSAVLSAGSLSSFFGGVGAAGASASATQVATAAAARGLYHSGRGPGELNTLGSLPRFHSGVGPNEQLAVIKDEESVLTPAQMKALTPARSGAPNIQILNYGRSSFEIQPMGENDIRIIAREEADKKITTRVPTLVATEVANPNSKVSKSLSRNTSTARSRN